MASPVWLKLEIPQELTKLLLFGVTGNLYDYLTTATPSPSPAWLYCTTTESCLHMLKILVRRVANITQKWSELLQSMPGAQNLNIQNSSFLAIANPAERVSRTLGAWEAILSHLFRIGGYLGTAVTIETALDGDAIFAFAPNMLLQYGSSISRRCAEVGVLIRQIPAVAERLELDGLFDMSPSMLTTHLDTLSSLPDAMQEEFGLAGSWGPLLDVPEL